MFFGAAILSTVGAAAQEPTYAQDGGKADGLRAVMSPSFAAQRQVPEQMALNTAAAGGTSAREAEAELPDAPVPQGADGSAAAGDWAGQNSSSSQSGSQDGSQSGSQQTNTGQSQHDRAEQEIKKQEQQRAFGIIPSFNTSFTGDVVPLNKVQKLQLAFRSSTDPFTFAEAFLFGGYRELGDNYSGYGWGVTGYMKRTGSAYADSFLGNMIGNGFLPGVLHQEPRYFQLGHGNVFYRAFYAAASAVRCKHDGTNHWEPNYSNVAGNLIAGAISNAYYPKEEQGWWHSISDGLVNTATGIIGSEFQEFWVDVARRLPKKKDQGASPAGKP